MSDIGGKTGNLRSLLGQKHDFWSLLGQNMLVLGFLGPKIYKQMKKVNFRGF